MQQSPILVPIWRRFTKIVKTSWQLLECGQGRKCWWCSWEQLHPRPTLPGRASSMRARSSQFHGYAGIPPAPKTSPWRCSIHRSVSVPHMTPLACLEGVCLMRHVSMASVNGQTFSGQSLSAKRCSDSTLILFSKISYKDYLGFSYDFRCAFFDPGKPGTVNWRRIAIIWVIILLFRAVLPVGIGWFVVVGLGGNPIF